LLLSAVLGLPPGGDPHPQRAAVFAERAGGQDAHAVAVQQVAGESLVGGHAVIGGQRAAPGAETGVEVEGGLRWPDIQPGGGEPARYGAADRRVQGPAAGDPFGKFRGLGEGRGGGVLDRAAVADQFSLAIPSARPHSARPAGLSGSRAAPARQPPRARLLLSVVVTTVRSGAHLAGLRNGRAVS